MDMSKSRGWYCSPVGCYQFKEDMKTKNIEERILDILAKHDVFMDIPNPIIASTEAKKLIKDLVRLFNTYLKEK